MSDNKLMKYSMRDLTEALIKDQGITEGKWMLSVEFGIGAINAGVDQQNLSPAAVVPLVSVGLIPSEADNNLTVDASALNQG